MALLALSIFALIQWGIGEAEMVRANDNASTAVAEQVRAENNAATAQANEKIAKENEAVAQRNSRKAGALALSAEAIIQKNNDPQLSLICQYSGEGLYEFRVSNAGLYSIDAYDPSNTSTQGYVKLAAGGSAAIKSGQSTNTNTAICNGGKLALVINGTLVNTMSDSNYNFIEGSIGIGVSSPNLLPVDVSIDSLTVGEP